MEAAPASQLGVVAIDGQGFRREWHFGELIARSAGLSGAMAARGVGHGDAVMTLIGSRIEWVLAQLGANIVDGIAVGVYPTSPSNEVAYVLAHSESEVIVCEDQEQVDKVLERRDEQDRSRPRRQS